MQTNRDEINKDISTYLALGPDIMANERTLLSYSRMALVLVVSGMGFIQFSESPVLKLVSLIFIPIGLLTFGYGVLRFQKKKREINRQRTRLNA